VKAHRHSLTPLVKRPMNYTLATKSGTKTGLGPLIFVVVHVQVTYESGNRFMTINDL
jgi:hypothetical protein